MEEAGDEEPSYVTLRVEVLESFNLLDRPDGQDDASCGWRSALTVCGEIVYAAPGLVTQNPVRIGQFPVGTDLAVALLPAGGDTSLGPQLTTAPLPLASATPGGRGDLSDVEGGLSWEGWLPLLAAAADAPAGARLRVAIVIEASEPSSAAASEKQPPPREPEPHTWEPQGAPTALGPPGSARTAQPASWEYLPPTSPVPLLDASLSDALEQPVDPRMSSLEAENAALKARLAAEPPPDPRLKALEAENETLRARLADKPLADPRLLSLEAENEGLRAELERARQQADTLRKHHEEDRQRVQDNLRELQNEVHGSWAAKVAELEAEVGRLRGIIATEMPTMTSAQAAAAMQACNFAEGGGVDAARPPSFIDGRPSQLSWPDLSEPAAEASPLCPPSLSPVRKIGMSPRNESSAAERQGPGFPTCSTFGPDGLIVGERTEDRPAEPPRPGGSLEAPPGPPKPDTLRQRVGGSLEAPPGAPRPAPYKDQAQPRWGGGSLDAPPGQPKGDCQPRWGGGSLEAPPGGRSGSTPGPRSGAGSAAGMQQPPPLGSGMFNLGAPNSLMRPNMGGGFMGGQPNLLGPPQSGLMPPTGLQLGQLPGLSVPGLGPQPWGPQMFGSQMPPGAQTHGLQPGHPGQGPSQQYPGAGPRIVQVAPQNQMGAPHGMRPGAYPGVGLHQPHVSGGARGRMSMPGAGTPSNSGRPPMQAPSANASGTEDWTPSRLLEGSRADFSRAEGSDFQRDMRPTTPSRRDVASST